MPHSKPLYSFTRICPCMIMRNFSFLSLKVFYEEELDVPLVLFDEVLDHVLRIDRIFKQPQVWMDQLQLWFGELKHYTTSSAHCRATSS